MAAQMNHAQADTVYVSLDDVMVRDRRREEYGDIDGLAKSIKQFGLFHPIVIDEKNNLIVGERRLRAYHWLNKAEQNGWGQIPARVFSQLSDNEKREIELEENLRRKDLTPYERSRTLVTLVEVAAQTIKAAEPPRQLLPNAGKNSTPQTETEVLATVTKTPNKGGRPSSLGVSEQKIAEKIGVPQKTINVARQHVEAVRKVPEVAGFTQKDAIATVRNLEKLPEPEREETLEKLRKGDKQTRAVLANKPPVDDTNPWEEARNDPIRKVHDRMGKLYTDLKAFTDGALADELPNVTEEWLLALLDKVVLTKEIALSVESKIRKELKKYGEKHATA